MLPYSLSLFRQHKTCKNKVLPNKRIVYKNKIVHCSLNIYCCVYASFFGELIFDFLMVVTHEQVFYHNILLIGHFAKGQKVPGQSTNFSAEFGTKSKKISHSGLLLFVIIRFIIIENLFICDHGCLLILYTGVQEQDWLNLQKKLI